MRVELDDAYRLWRYHSSDAERGTKAGKLIEALAEETRKLHAALNWVGCLGCREGQHHRPDTCPGCVARKALSPPPSTQKPGEP